MWRALVGLDPSSIDARLAAEVGGRQKSYQTIVRELPRYRFVDLYRAAEHYCQAAGIVAKIESDYRYEYLGSILHGKPASWVSRRLGRSERVAWPVGPRDEVFPPVDVFWVCRAGGGREPLIVRVHHDAKREKTFVETAGRDAGWAESSMADILAPKRRRVDLPQPPPGPAVRVSDAGRVR